MKHIFEITFDGGDVLNCLHCGDQLKLTKGGWPFWMHLAIRDAFSSIHGDCQDVGAAKGRSIFETLTYERPD